MMAVPPLSQIMREMTSMTFGIAAAKDMSTLMLQRGAAFLILWICLIGPVPSDIVFGVLAAAVAAWVSLPLWPAGSFSGANLPRYALRFVRQSISAGVEVAQYAFSSKIDLKPGFATYQTAVPPGVARDALCTIMSLLPGKLPVGTAADGTIRIHCLDTRHTVASELSEDEAAFLKVFRSEPSRG
jgi:multicomponent Na+:H+ antiporter subunit E